MGTIFKYKCSNCKYTDEVSGGADIGFFIKTKTGFCSQCNRLVDVVIEDKFAPVSARVCPICEKDIKQWWVEGKPCPLCQGKMINMGCVLQWD